MFLCVPIFGTVYAREHSEGEVTENQSLSDWGTLRNSDRKYSVSERDTLIELRDLLKGSRSNSV